jgi:RNA polymerase sigma-70 factor (ECF subfamily)
MDLDGAKGHLSNIETQVGELAKMFSESEQTAMAAREAMCKRYSGAVYRYLLAALRNKDAADEVFQDFWVRFFRGAFRNYDPERGRFRALLKTALYHLIVDYRKDQAKQDRLRRTGAEIEDMVASNEDEIHSELDQNCHQELLDRTWLALAEAQMKTAQPLFAVLRFKSEHPQVSSKEMAEKLSELLRQPLTDAGVRQILRRARDKFAELLVQEVAQTLDSPSQEELVQELIDLDLLRYCRSALEKKAE